MKINKYVSLFVINVILLVSVSGCKSSCDCSDRKFVTSLLTQMSFQETDDGFFADSKCLYAAAKVLEKITGHKRHTKYGHWGEHYEGFKTLKLDSLSYDSILIKMNEDELQLKVINNCADVIEVLNLECLDDYLNSDCECYTERLRTEYIKNK